MFSSPVSWVLALLALAFAVLSALAVYRDWTRVQFVAKPGVMVSLLLWLWVETGLRGGPFWFGLGAFFSLIGDIFLLWPDRGFLPGLGSFLVAQIAYLIGFNALPGPISLWSMLLAVVLAIGAARVMRRLIAGVNASGHPRLARPILIYGVVITLMLLSALLTLSNTAWKGPASLAATLGAFLIFMSDIILAWNRFVSPLRSGRLLCRSLYEAGQILLIGGVILQFS